MSKSVQIAILAYPGCMQSAVLGLQDILAFAQTAGGIDMPLAVLREFPIEPACYDAVILPPSSGEVRAGDVADLPGFLKYQHASGAVICSACTGLAFVAAAGLPGGRKVTTHWALEQRILATYPDLHLDTGRLLIEYTDLITAGGLMAWVDLALVLIERFQGYAAAVKTARHFIVDFRRRDQRRFRRFIPELRHGDGAILKVQLMLEDCCCGPVTVTEMAVAAGLAGRTFLRRFTAVTGLSPKAYLQELRVERARSLLIETDKSVSEICFATGYNDPPSFARLFTSLSGLPPGAFREHYRRKERQE